MFLESFSDMNRDLTCICGSCDFSLKFSHDKPAKGDKVFFPIEDDYLHEIHECARCGHFLAWNSFDDAVLYDGQYVQTTYGDKLKATFEKIINLPHESSDNAARVDNILQYMGEYFPDNSPKSVMDVGSGLCVFLHQMRKLKPDWQYLAVDPDPVQSAHARDTVGIDAVQADFMELDNRDNSYDFISFNKVLEHVPNPVSMLSKTKSYIKEGGLVYVELPDGSEAAKEGADRQEFYVEHLSAFSMPSITILAERAGFVPLKIERIRDPSRKYTLRAFMNIEGAK